MSMRTSIVHGYGFEMHGDENVIANFVNKHAATIVKRNKSLEISLLNDCHYENIDNIIDDYDDIECDVTGHQGLVAIIANIISEETGISFQYESGDDACGSSPTILFCEAYPWQMNEIEKQLTEDKLENIINKYIDELGIITTKGYMEVEYYE